jgi:hypothetical protein
LLQFALIRFKKKKKKKKKKTVTMNLSDFFDKLNETANDSDHENENNHGNENALKLNGENRLPSTSDSPLLTFDRLKFVQLLRMNGLNVGENESTGDNDAMLELLAKHLRQTTFSREQLAQRFQLAQVQLDDVTKLLTTSKHDLEQLTSKYRYDGDESDLHFFSFFEFFFPPKKLTRKRQRSQRSSGRRTGTCEC